MNYKTWPKPPLENFGDIPQIPQRLNIFGTIYNNKNKYPEIDQISQPLDKKAIINKINQSFNHFLNIINNFNSEEVDKLVDLHIQMHEIINKAMKYEGFRSLEEAKQFKTNLKNDLKKEIEKKI